MHGHRALVIAAATVLVATTAVAPASAAPITWTVSAPSGGSVSAQVTRNDNGALTFAVRRGGSSVIAPSAIGIRTSGADLTTGLAFGSRSDRVVTDSYRMTTGKRLQRQATFNETTLTFTGAGNTRLDLVVRVSADGAAYRYVLPNSGSAQVLSEASSWELPAGAPAWLQPFTVDNQGKWFESTASAAPTDDYGYAALFEVGGTYALLAESDVSGRYAGSKLDHVAGSGRYTTTLLSQANTVGPVATPWRLAIVGDLATVATSTLVDDLAPPSKIADTSWIRPGTVGWSWLSDHGSPSDAARQRQFIDFAQKNKWPYVLIDEGWNASWIADVIRYAQERGVGVVLWYNEDKVTTPALQDQVLQQVRAWGAVGVKVDFIYENKQSTLQWFDSLLAKAAQFKLMVNFHGAEMPRGMQRTWPHVMTAEGIFGAEQKQNKAAFNTMLPFTRNVISSMDYTPVTPTIGNRDTTEGHELATFAAFESGWQHPADSPETYTARPDMLRMLNKLPTTWDETRLLGGRPNREVYLARRHAHRWYVSGLSSLPAKTYSTSLSFLGSGQWFAETIRDGSNGGLTWDTRVVTSADSLSVPIATRGGFVTILCPYTPGTTTCGNPNGNPPTGSRYLSDLPYLSSNAWGPVEKDRSNGEVAVGDGKALTIAGTTYAKGLGVHADSTISVNLGGNCTRFDAAVGVDDEVSQTGSVVFAVSGDGESLATTPLVRRGDAARAVSVDVTGIATLVLRVTDGGDGRNYDHADWGNARLTCK